MRHSGSNWAMFHLTGLYLARWLVALLYLDVGRCMWTPRPERIYGTSIGPKDDIMWKMKGNTYQEDYCPLNTAGEYPYLVKIWSDDPDDTKQIRTGSLLSHRAVLTACRGFHAIPRYQLKVFAHRQFKQEKGSRSSNYCHQYRLVKDMIEHPNCKTVRSPNVRFYDFQVLVLDQMFFAEHEFAYPVIQIPKQPYDLWQFIRRLGIFRLPMEGCEMPYFARPNQPWPVMEYRAPVDIVRENNYGCARAICWNSQHWRVEQCLQTTKKYLHNTYLCVYTRWRTVWPRDRDAFIPELGFPLICNNTGVGIGTHAFEQRIIPITADRRTTSDLVMVATFLRVWPWLMKMKRTYWDKNYNRLGQWDNPFLERHTWQRYVYTTPKWDKNVAKDLKRFHLRVQGVHSLSDGNRILSTPTVASLIAIQVSLIPIIWIV